MSSSRGTICQNLTIKEQYIAQQAQGIYITMVCQPEAMFDLSTTTQAVEPTKIDIKALNKCLLQQIQNGTREIQFVQLDQQTLQLLVFTDTSFINNNNLSSQIGFVIALTNTTGQANLLHQSLIKCKQVTQSILALELYTMAYSFDLEGLIKSTFKKVLALPNLLIVLYIDLKSLYNCLVKLGTTQKKCLIINVMCLCQAYKRYKIGEVR